MVAALVFSSLRRGIACLFIFLFHTGIHLFLHAMLAFSLTAALGRGSSPDFSGSFFIRVGWLGEHRRNWWVGFGGCRNGAWKLEIRVIGGDDWWCVIHEIPNGEKNPC
jgi:hypothetical protein